MYLGYSKRNPMQYIIWVPSGAKTLKYISPVELNFKIPVRVKSSNSQSQRSQNFELQILSEDETFFPNGVKSSTSKPQWKPSSFLQIPRRVSLKPDNSPESHLKTVFLSGVKLSIHNGNHLASPDSPANCLKV